MASDDDYVYQESTDESSYSSENEDVERMIFEAIFHGLRSKSGGTKRPHTHRHSSGPTDGRPPATRRKSNISRAIIPVENVTTLEGLIALGESYDKKNLYSIDGVDKIAAAVPALKKLAALHGMEEVKRMAVRQVKYLVQGLNSSEDFLHTVLYGPPGCGKCLGINTPVIMYDGSIKMVQDIVVGDLLMGDDSTPRTVLSLARGREQMYRVKQLNGDDYVVNESHILSLKATDGYRIINSPKENRYKVTYMENGTEKTKTFYYAKAEYENKKRTTTFASAEAAKITAEQYIQNNPVSKNIWDVSVKEFLSKSQTIQSRYKGYKVGVEFQEKELCVDPYLLGLWLGDGSSWGSGFTSVDEPIIQYLRDKSADMGLGFTECPQRIHYNIRTGVDSFDGNLFLQTLQNHNLIKNKHIPDIYKYNSRENRLRLLAGIIDTDGYYTNNCYEIVQKNKRLADDIVYLARSLGFAVTTGPCEKTCTNSANGRVTGTYYRSHISGSGLDQIPVLLERKKAHPRQQIKDALVTGITIEKLEVDDYYGFEIDGNRRFLLGDFTVTHNTTVVNVLGEIFAAVGFLKKGHVHTVNRADLVGKYVGHTAPKVLAAVKAAFGGVLLIDEFYALGSSKDSSDGFDKECIDMLNQCLSEHRHEFVCIVAGYEEDINKYIWPMNKGLKRRFPWQYTISEYKTDDMLKILDTQVSSQGWTLSAEAQSALRTAVDAGTVKFVNFGGDTESLLTKCKIAYGDRIFGSAHDYTITAADMAEAIAMFTSGTKTVDTKWEQDIRWRMYS